MVPSPESPPLTVGTLMLPSLETPSLCGPQVTSGSLGPISHVSQTLSSDRSHPQTSCSKKGNVLPHPAAKFRGGSHQAWRARSRCFDSVALESAFFCDGAPL